ncbi:hypothetical protein VDR66_18555, partial [Xanthomonas campestris pv. campestris]|nr:hypothetical protein [Xanthomonas campestris pv. campestris]
RLLLIGTSESTIFHGLEMSRKPWAYQMHISLKTKHTVTEEKAGDRKDGKKDFGCHNLSS